MIPLGLNQAYRRKQTKLEYNCLLTDLTSVDWQVNYNTVEIGSLGHFTLYAIIEVLPYAAAHINDATSILVRAASTAITCSQPYFALFAFIVQLKMFFSPHV